MSYKDGGGDIRLTSSHEILIYSPSTVRFISRKLCGPTSCSL